ncbi:MAG: helix-turn-helix domain-containing protein [Candidatus Beckwithbacteria bacterium]|nr:helix-turn-helix domain-containing protein [Candidatus Beckwithbacteria bacterium]
MSDIPELITLKEASKILKVHPNTLRLWDKNGILPAVRIGEKKVRRYRKIDIENFIKKNERK